MLKMNASCWGNSRSNNGNWKGGLNSFRLDHLDDLLGTKFIQVLKEKLFSLSEENGTCLNWIRKPETGGYGTLMVGNRPHMAHRLSYLVNVGPLGDFCVLHKCDNRLCINPAHLFLGSKTDNMVDRDAKGRQSKGEKVNTAKLTESQIIEAKRLRKKGLKYKEIAALIKCPTTVDSLIAAVTGTTWKHLIRR